MKNNTYRIAIISSEFNQEINKSLLMCALDELKTRGINEKNIVIVKVPGAYELPLMAQSLAQQKKWDAILCFGCVIKGETSHDQYVAQWASFGCGQVSLKFGIPVLFGVLTPHNEKQAWARSKPGSLNRGKEVAGAAINMIETLKSLGRKKR